MVYNIILFLHILGTVIMFVAIGLTLTSMLAMLHATKMEPLRVWSSLAVKIDGLLPFSVILVLVPGLYLVYDVWGWGNSWVNISLGTLVIITLMGPIINLRRLKDILATVNNSTVSLPTTQLLDKVQDRVLWNSVCVMTMLILAILFLMTVKLELIGCLVTIFISVLMGLILATVLLKRAPVSTSLEHS